MGHSVFDCLLSLDLRNEIDIYNARETLREFLARHGQAVSISRDSQDFEEALATQPGWLDVLETPYFQREVWSKREDRSGKELHDWLADQFLRLFRYADIPPEWLQNPEWPIGEKGPLVFLGQMPVQDYWDSRTVVYVFYEESTKKCETVIQMT